MIDELIHHCINEIGLDGETGTEIDRLADFIRDFHTEYSCRSEAPPQLVDASYQAFVFRQLLGHPDVRVGLLVPGVADKSGAKSGITKRKANMLDSPGPSKAEPQVEASSEFDWVDLLPDQSLAQQQGLFQLRQTHGEHLRLVLQLSAIKRLLVGADDAVLPPSTFRVLQIICRSREKPVVSMDIGSTLHMDQKTVFYICKRLIDLGLVTKIKARETGTAASYFVATKFEDRCEILIQQRNADVAADLHHASQSTLVAPEHSTSDLAHDALEADDDADGEADDEAGTLDASAPTITVKEEGQQQQSLSTTTQPAAAAFEYVDPEKADLWLKSRPELVRLRIYLVCDQTSSKVTSRIGLSRRINMASGRPQIRAFVRMLEHTVVDGFLDVVNIHVASTGRTHKGLRMTPKGMSEMQNLLRGNFSDASSVQEQEKASRLNLRLQQDLSRMDPALPRELTLERHVYEQVASAGASGRTTNQLTTLLHGSGHFARAIEQLIMRAEGADGEPSMSDLRIRSFHEHKLRVRSTKLLSHHAWVLQCANEGYLDEEDLQLLAAAGGPSSFHLKSSTWTVPGQTLDRLTALSKDLSTPTPRKLGRPPKKHPMVDDPDTPVRMRGRPRKHPIEETDPNTPPKKRGRPRKSVVDSPGGTPVGEPSKTPAKRGRPRKHSLELAEVVAADDATTSTPTPNGGGSLKQQVDPSGASLIEAAHSTSSLKASAPYNDGQDDEPMAEETQSSSKPATLPGDEGSRVANDSPTASIAKRRGRRPLRDTTPTRPTSSLAATPGVEAAEEPQQKKAPEGKSSTAPAPSHREQEPVVGRASPDEVSKSMDAPTQAAATSDLSRVQDLLSTPAKFKQEATEAIKRLAPSTPTSTASDRKKRTNLTQLRSSHALVQCIREAGGAMDTLSVPDQLSDFVERNGFVSDAQLLNLRDKKVRDKALSAAIDAGMLRRTYVKIDRPNVAFSRRQIVYVSDLPSEQLQSYCEAVRTGEEGWTDSKNAKTALMNVTDNVAVSFVDAVQIAKPWHSDDVFRLADLPSDPAQLAVLRQPFKDVISVYRQHMGFLGGEMLRLKAFHHALAKYVDLHQSAEADGPVALPLSFFWTKVPLDLFLGLVPIPHVSERIEGTLLDPRDRTLAVQDLPTDVRAAIGVLANAPNDAHVAMYSLATQLSALGIVRLHSDPTRSEPVLLTTSVELLHRIPTYDWACEEQEKPLTGVVHVGLDEKKINLLWAQMQATCLSVRKGAGGLVDEFQAMCQTAQSGSAAGPNSDSSDDIDPFKRLPEELANSLCAHRSWRPYHQLRPSQVKFLYRISIEDIPSAIPDIVDRLGYVTLAPPQVVQRVLQIKLQRYNESNDADVAAPGRVKPRFTWPLKLSSIALPTNVYRPPALKTSVRARATPAEREKQGRLTTMTKARQLRQRREEQFQAMLDQAFGETEAAAELRNKIEKALVIIRKRFVAGDVRFDADAAQKAILRTVRSSSGQKVLPEVRALTTGRRTRRPLRNQGRDDEQADADADGSKASGKRDRRGRRNVDQGHFWTPARKELLRDAAVILRVRDQVRGRSDWSALFQIIDLEERTKTKSVIMAQWRNQYYRMRSLHGEEAYLAALESRWVPVYVAAREEGVIADPDFPNPTGFDLVAQIDLLRERIDKNGVQRSLTKPIARHHLPVDLNMNTDFTSNWKEEFNEEATETRFETFFAGETGITSKRFETLLGTALGDEATVPHGADHTNIEEVMAEWAVRIVIATSKPSIEVEGPTGAKVAEPMDVDEAAKADFCRGIGDSRIEHAMQRLLDTRLIRSLTFDPIIRRKPGTNFVLTEELLKLIPHVSSRSRLAAEDLLATITHRRSALEKACDHPIGVVVEPAETDGEAASLLLLMELGLMDGDVDGRAFEGLRQNLAFNARVLNDDDLESLLAVKGQAGVTEVLNQATLPLPDIPSDEALEWLNQPTGVNVDLVWSEQFEKTLSTVGSASASAAERLRLFGMRLLPAREKGLAATELSYHDVVTLTTGPRPLAFFSPLTTHPVLVASAYVELYILPLSSGTGMPHIWTTLSAPSLAHWRNLLDTVTALTLQRPGMNLACLAARFSTTTDAGKEVVGTSFNDLWHAVQELVQAGVVDLKDEGGGGGLNRLTLHPGERRVVWAGFT